MVEPDIDCPVPFKFTVPVPAVKVPPLLAQLPATESVLLVEMNVPPERVKDPESVIVLAPPVNVPLD